VSARLLRKSRFRLSRGPKSPNEGFSGGEINAMNGKRWRGACSALVLILTATQGPVAAARPSPALDGAPTPEACAKLGFESRPSRSFASGAYAAMPPPPPPSPMMAAPEMRALPAPPAALARIAPPVFETPAQRDTERYPNATPNPVRRTAEAPVSTFSIDVDTRSRPRPRRRSSRR